MAGPLTQVLATSDGKTDRRRIRIGDIVEIATPKGFAYAQYTHEHPQYGSLIRVLPGLHAERRPDLSRLAQGRHLWVVFFPVRVGVRRGMIELAAHADVPPEAAAFSLFKVAGLDDPKTGRVLNRGLEVPLSAHPGAQSAFVTASESLPSGLSPNALARLAGIKEANVGGIVRVFIPDVTGIATPIQSGAPGFIGRGLTSGGLPEFVVPNSAVQTFQFVLERVGALVGALH